jgi:hypothetical protein
MNQLIIKVNLIMLAVPPMDIKKPQNISKPRNISPKYHKEN